MTPDVELVQMGPNGEIKIPKRFHYEGAPLRGEYVIPPLQGDPIVMVPADDWKGVTDEGLSYAENSVDVRRFRRTFSPRARLMIDRYGRFALPLRVRRQGGLSRHVTLQLIGCTLHVEPAGKFEETLESARWANAEMENYFQRLNDPISSSARHSHSARRRRVQPRLIVPAERIPHLGAEKLEAFVRECFWRMGFRCAQVGRTHQADGGVDLIVCSAPSYQFPHLLAVQVKSTRGGRPTPERVVRDFFGAVQSHPVSGGVLITSSKFTDDARRFAEKHKQMLWLRDIADLTRWNRSDFRARQFTAEVNSVLCLRKGVKFSVAGGCIRRSW